MQSETADHVLWTQYAEPSPETQNGAVGAALTRIQFRETSSSVLLRTINEQAATLEDGTAERRSRLMIVVGRSRRLAVEDHSEELKGLMAANAAGYMTSEVKKTIGDVAASLIVSGSKASIVVLQAGLDA